MSALVDKCILNAKELFRELEGECYPFGFTINKENNIAPYYVYTGDEYPKPLTVIKSLAYSLLRDLKDDKYLEVAICSLCSKKVDEDTFEFLDIKAMNNKQISKDYVVVIDPDYEKNIFTVVEIMEFVGTIKAFIE